MELAFFADEVSKEDFDEALKLGVEAGATGVEIRGGIWGKRIQEIDDDTVKRVQDALAKHGVKVSSIGSPFGKCAHDSKEEQDQHHRIFERMVALTDAFDTPIIRGFALWNPYRKEPGRPRPEISEFLDVMVPFVEPAVRTAGAKGVTLSLENEDATLVGSCAEAVALAKALGDPKGLSFCWDVNNGVACDERAYPDGYDLIKGRITHLHVKPNTQTELDPIEGSDMKYIDLLKQMLADGYTGAASIEHWGTPELMLKGVRLLRPVLDSL